MQYVLSFVNYNSGCIVFNYLTVSLHSDEFMHYYNLAKISNSSYAAFNPKINLY